MTFFRGDLRHSTSTGYRRSRRKRSRRGQALLGFAKVRARSAASNFAVSASFLNCATVK